MQFIVYEARRQDENNRQNSINDLPEDVKEWFENVQILNFNECWRRYEHALALGIAKECARNLLPLNTATRMHMKGSVRSWIHYFQVRCHPSSQKEHRDIALAGRNIFCQHFPIIAEALNFWVAGAIAPNQDQKILVNLITLGNLLLPILSNKIIGIFISNGVIH